MTFLVCPTNHQRHICFVHIIREIEVAKNKILKVIPLEKNVSVVVVEGKHIGKSGKIAELTKEGENLIAKIRTKSGEEISSNVNNIFVTE